MKICILTENYYRGGLDTFIINLINNWPDKNDTFTLICNKSHPGLIDIKNKTYNTLETVGYNFFFTRAISNGFSKNVVLRSFPFRVFFRILNNFLDFPFLFFRYFLFFKKYFGINKFDYLLSINGGYPASLICRTGLISWNSLYGRKNSYLFFHSHAMKIRPFFKFIDIYMDKLIFNSVSMLITVSHSCLISITKRNDLFLSKKVIYIYNGVEDLNNKYPNSFKDNNNFVMLSTYTSIKGYDLLIKIVKKLKILNSNFQIKVFGYGKKHEYSRIKKKIYNNNLQEFIEINSFTDDPHLIIKNSKALLCLSQSQEAFGLTLIEAMSLGVPILTTNVGGLREVFKGSEAGYIFDKNDVNGFVHAMSSLINNNNLKEKFSIKARKHYIKYFTSTKMAKNYHDIIKKNKN